MSKLIEAYREIPSLSNAKKIAAYDRKHPMAACLLTIDESKVVAEAVAHAKLGWHPAFA